MEGWEGGSERASLLFVVCTVLYYRAVSISASVHIGRIMYEHLYCSIVCVVVVTSVILGLAVVSNEIWYCDSMWKVQTREESAKGDFGSSLLLLFLLPVFLLSFLALCLSRNTRR